MNLDELSFLNTLLWLLPLVLLAALVGIGILGRNWRRKAFADMKTAGSLLRRIQGVLGQISGEISGLSPEDPEPFGRRVIDLQAKIDQVRSRLVEINQRYVRLQESARPISAAFRLFSVLIPTSWYRLQREAGNLVIDLQAELGDQESTRMLAESLSHLGWEIAQQARQVYLVQQESKLLFEKLHSVGLSGEKYESANLQRKQIRERLDQIPVYFFRGDEAEIIKLAQREDIILTYSNIEAAKLELEQVISMGSEWETRLAEVGQSVQALSRAVNGAQRLLSSASGVLNLSGLESQLAVLQSRTHDLQAFLDAPDVERLSGVMAQAELAMSELGEIQGKFGQSRQDLAALKKASGQVRVRLQEAAAATQALTDHPTLPVDMSRSVSEILQLQRQSDELDKGDGLRDQEDIPVDLAETLLVVEQIQDFERKLELVEQQHSELAGILDDPAVQDFDSWLESARQLVERLESYAQENFAPEDRISGLYADLQEMEQTANALRSSGEKLPIAESEIGRQLEAGLVFIQAQRISSQRLAGLQKRLVQLEQEERHAFNLTEDAQMALSQIAFLVRSNSFLAGAAGKSLPDLQNEVKRVGIALENREKGRIEDKARLAGAVTKRVLSAAMQWLVALGQEIQAQSQAIAAVVAALDPIASLEEGAISEVRGMLASLPAYPPDASLAQEGLPLVRLIPEFKQRSDFWQRCVGVRKAILEIEAPVRRAHAQAAEAQQQVHQALDTATAWMAQRSSWPPNGVNLQEERAEVGEIDQRWQAQKSKPVNALQLVEQLGEFSAGYQALRERVQARSDQAANEMSRAEEVEADLNELSTLWQNQWYAYRQDPAVSGEIRALLDEIEKTLKNIRGQYKRKSMEYEQVMSALKDLYRKVRFYQVELDAGHAVDAMGNIQRRR
ncbi:MAG: hypothetical protein A2Z16_13205 [Chloroflexi bacterium RBG_16_54_18]|nr:MAG: hypothetical protein A2Z16_13205 [Chloroflexi bacterium RBG_16_54_18]